MTYPNTHCQWWDREQNQRLDCRLFKPFSPLMSVCRCAHTLSHVWLFATPWTVVPQAPLSMEMSKQENWSRMPFPSPGDLPDPGIEPVSPESLALAGQFFTTEPPGKPSNICKSMKSLYPSWLIFSLCAAYDFSSEVHFRVWLFFSFVKKIFQAYGKTRIMDTCIPIT